MIRAVVVSRMPWSQGIIEATGNTLPVAMWSILRNRTSCLTLCSARECFRMKEFYPPTRKGKEGRPKGGPHKSCPPAEKLMQNKSGEYFHMAAFARDKSDLGNAVRQKNRFKNSS